MNTSPTSSPEEQEALKEWRKNFIEGPVYQKPNEIWLDNSSTFEDDEGKTQINADYGKLFLKYTENDENFKVEVNLQEAEFLPVKIRVQINCKDFDEDARKFKYSIREADQHEDIVIRDINKDIVYEGPYTPEIKEQYNLKMSHVLYCFVKRDKGSAIDKSKMFKWNIGGAHLGNWFDMKKVLEMEGRPHTFKIFGRAEKKTGKNKYYELAFTLGSPVSALEAAPLVKEVNQLLSSKKSSMEQVEVKEEAKQVVAPAQVEKHGTNGREIAGLNSKAVSPKLEALKDKPIEDMPWEGEQKPDQK